jgi:inorganic triphosphatase YgiF
MEVELKLLITPPDAQLLWDHPLVKQHATAKPVQVPLSDTYFDTPDLLLRHADAALRVRHAGDEYWQTLKAGGKVVGGLHSRHEWESRIADSKPDLAALRELLDRKTPWSQLLRSPLLEEGLVPVFTSQVTRLKLDLRLPQGDCIELVLDQGHLECGTSILPISEVELELKSGDPANLLDFALALQQNIPLQTGALSKADRGFELLDPQPAHAVKATPVKLRKRMTVEQVFQAITDNCIAQIQANGASLAKAYDVDCLHQMRVGLRRLRSALAGFKDVLQAPGDLQQELAWLASQLGTARDWDVMVGSTLPAAAGESPGNAQLSEVQCAALAKSNELHAAVSAALASPRHTRLVLSLTRWVCGCGWRASMSERDQRRLSAGGRKFGHKLLTNTRRRLLKRGGKARQANPEECHRLRIAVKKMRYATEFFQAFYPSKQIQACAGALEELQDDLGCLIDATVAGHLLLELAAGQPHLAPGAELVRDHLESNIDGLDLRIRKALTKFAAMKFLE